MPLFCPNLQLQEALSDLMLLEVERARVRQLVLDDVEIRRQRAKDIGNEILEEVRRSTDNDKARVDAAGARIEAATSAAFDALDADVAAVRDTLTRSVDALDDWHDRAAAKQNAPLFFGQLYRGSGRVGLAGDEQEVARVVDAMRDRLAVSVRSPLRLMTALAFAAGMVYVAYQDVRLSNEPHAWQDALYISVAASVLVNAACERRELRKPGESTRRAPFGRPRQ
uniref:Uncharacterized protein n=1 Tax=Chlamydomonas euryale TaxID=1486919 RepID=A0A7R9V4U1_9CHLO|mmetsp:Transcript_16168/g.48021  ORF Transcript_16168/g.48021 Transcript_16168/m.48021 type:complete len:225 (+) Transcript_16168:855-1529(+)